MPYAFTEQGIAMFSSVLKSDVHTPMIVFNGCNTAKSTTQDIADYFGVPVRGNTTYSSFSHDKYVYEKIDTWGTEHNIYLGVCGNRLRKHASWLFGKAYRDFGKTYKP